MARKPVKKPKFRPITCWAEVAADGTFTCYDLAPTKAGIEASEIPEGTRAVKVRVVLA